MSSAILEVEPSEQLLHMRFAANEEPAPFMAPGEKVARKLMKDNPAKFAEILESLERIHWQKEVEQRRRRDEEEARQRAEAAQLGTQAPETHTTDYGAEKVLDKLRELSERAET